MAADTSDAEWSPPRPFIIDLSLPPASRWEHIAAEFRDDMADLYREYLLAAEAELGRFHSFGSTALHYFFRRLASREVYAELQGLAAALEGTGWTVATLAAFNLGYEVVARCTSACVQIPATPVDTMAHLRNMDWDMPTMRKVTLHLTFMREGAEVFQGIGWLGLVGLWTGCRKGVASVSLNYRKSRQGALHGALSNFAMLTQGAWASSLLLRHTLESPAVTSYDDVVQLLSGTRLLSPCYLIAAGPDPGQSLILERDRRPKSLDPSPALVKVATNCDAAVEVIDPAWAAGDVLLLSAPVRRSQAAAMLHKLRAVHETLTTAPERSPTDTPSIGSPPPPVVVVDALFAVLEGPEVFNDQTIYSCVMLPAAGQIHCKVWDAATFAHRSEPPVPPIPVP